MLIYAFAHRTLVFDVWYVKCGARKPIVGHPIYNELGPSDLSGRQFECVCGYQRRLFCSGQNILFCDLLSLLLGATWMAEIGRNEIFACLKSAGVCGVCWVIKFGIYVENLILI